LGGGEEVKSRFGIGFDWVCFGGGGKVENSRISLLLLGLRSFEQPENWVCFA
jgi:hypothetical protein